ncbi:unnamed protein product [Pseudo-nitzschia multistriata]|uniref:Uncharacterized protein n=1 Tax=Pseudo-nitzschia multistriata TaxID=183589 RepID=A0A448YVQ1_9STRA|nr:unnamed protein product [Pseudo-nitzschia multistriata]
MTRNNLSRRMTTLGVATLAYAALVAPMSTSAFMNPTCTAKKLSGPTATTLYYMPLDQVSDFYQNFPLQSAVLTCGVKASVADTIAQVKPQLEEQKNERQQQHEASLSTFSQREGGITQRAPRHASDDSLEEQSRHRFDFAKSVSSGNKQCIGWEATRNLAYVLYGGIFVGLMSHIEYNMIFPAIFGQEKTFEIIVKEVCFDNLIVAPTMWLPPAYFIKACVYSASSDEDSGPGGIFREGLEKYLADVRDNQLLQKYWSIWFPAHSISFSVVPDHLRVAFMASISFFWFILFSSVSSQGDAGAGEKTTRVQ